MWNQGNASSQEAERRKRMKLYEKLQICLLAIASRYPESTLESNEEVLGPQSLQKQRCTPLELIERVQSSVPKLLEAPALLVVDAQERAIYLVEQSQHTPAFWLRYRERTREEAIASLRRENAALKAENRELKTLLAQALPVEGRTRTPRVNGASFRWRNAHPEPLRGKWLYARPYL
jgi:hypothetical protein